MNLHNKLKKILVSFFAIFAVVLTSGHFCSISNYPLLSHIENQTAPDVISYNTTDSYHECCENKASGQLTAVVQQVQKFALNAQSVITATSITSPIYTTTGGNNLLQSVSLANKLDPGGGLVLLC